MADECGTSAAAVADLSAAIACVCDSIAAVAADLSTANGCVCDTTAADAADRSAASACDVCGACSDERDGCGDNNLIPAFEDVAGTKGASPARVLC